MAIFRRPMRSMRMMTRSSGSGQQTSVLLEPVARLEVALLCWQKGQDGLEREDAEVSALGNAQAARLGELEVVADLETAHGAALDSLHRDSQVVELGDVAHRAFLRATSSVGGAW